MKDESDYAGWRRYACAGLSFLECLLFSGLIYGWAPLVYIFKHEGVYAYLCEVSEKENQDLLLYNSSSSSYTHVDTTTYLCLNCSATEAVSRGHGCKDQDDRYALAFTIGSTVYCASSAIFGHINLKFDTRITRIIAMTFFIGGSLMLAFTSRDIPWLMFPGLCCLGMGGLPILVTNVQVSNLFENGASTFVGVLAGAYDFSSFIMQVAKIAFENGVGRKSFLIGLACCHCLVGINTFFFLPKGFITKSVMKKDLSLSVELSPNQEKPAVKEESPKVTPAPKPKLKQCLLSPLYIIHVTWLCILQLRFFYFIGTLNPFLHRITKGREILVSHFTNVLSYSMMGGIVTTTFAGLVYDWQRRIFKYKKTETARHLFPTVFPLSVASCLSLIMSVLLLLPYVDVLYLSYVTMTFMRSFLYGVGTSFVAVMYPSEYFGLLYGIMIVSGGLTSALQFPLFYWAQANESGYFHVDIFLIVIVLLSFGHPIIQFWKSRRSEKEYHSQPPSTKESEKFL